MKNIPALDPKVLGLVTEISKEPKVEAAIAFIKDQTEVAMLEQIELCEIEAPTFHEEKRAASVAERMRQYGLTDVHIDEIGNVIGIRKGSRNGPVSCHRCSYGFRVPGRNRRQGQKRRQYLPSSRHR